MGWIEAHDEALRKHMATGISFREAAAKLNAEFDTNYSRNAAIGRAKRIKIESTIAPTHGGGSRTPRIGAPPWEAVGVSKRTYYRHQQIAKGGYTPPVHKHRLRMPEFRCDETGLRVVDVVPLNISIYELTKETCHWPYGAAPPFFYCGHNTWGGSSWCEPHAALAQGQGTASEQAADKGIAA